MAYAGHYRHVFDVPVLRPKRPRRAAPDIFRKNTDLIDLEFGSYGRDPRFPSGWFILPGVMAGVVIVLALLTL
jgi:hypothetical protein